MTSVGGNDPVNPSHYDGDHCMRAIEECTKGLTGSEGFLIGVIIKYLWRWKEKDGLQDLNKAKWYLERLIGNVGVEEGPPGLLDNTTKEQYEDFLRQRKAYFEETSGLDLGESEDRIEAAICTTAKDVGDNIRRAMNSFSLQIEEFFKNLKSPFDKTPKDIVYRTSELCVSCGRYCPEGSQVCEPCEIQNGVD